MMYQIGIVSKRPHLLVQVQALLGRDFELRPQVFFKAEDLMARLEKRELQGVIYSFPVFGASQHQLVLDSLQLYPSLPILVIADLVGPTARRSIRNLGTQVFLKEVGRLEEVPGIMKKLILRQKICARVHERYSAPKTVSVQSESGISSSRLLNISRGGVLLRTFGSLQIPEKFADAPELKIEVPASFPIPSRVIKGDVVWLRNESQNFNRMTSQLIGIQFKS